MSKFKVTYPSGLVEEVEQTECMTIEQFVNVKFGSVDYAANGVTVEMVGVDEVAVVIDEEIKVDEPIKPKSKNTKK